MPPSIRWSQGRKQRLETVRRFCERGFAADCGRCRRLHSYSLLDDAVQRRLAVCSLCAEGQQQECRVDADVWSSQGWRDGCSKCSQPQKRETQASMRACMRSARTHSSKMRRPVSWSNSHVLSTGRTVESWPSFTIVRALRPISSFLYHTTQINPCRRAKFSFRTALPGQIRSLASPRALRRRLAGDARVFLV